MECRPMRGIDRPRTVVDLARVRANTEAIARRTGVPLIAVVKADAYGLGSRRVVEAIDDLVDSYYVLDAAETLLYEGANTSKPTIAMLGASDDANDYLSRRI